MIDKILNERQEKYGDFEGCAELSQSLKNAIREHPGYEEIESYQQEALEMILHKVARIVNGNPDYIDSWAGIAGYSQLVVNILKK